jgi:hypothetical protein
LEQTNQRSEEVRRREEEEGGRRRKKEAGGGRRRKEEEGGGRRRYPVRGTFFFAILVCLPWFWSIKPAVWGGIRRREEEEERRREGEGGRRREEGEEDGGRGGWRERRMEGEEDGGRREDGGRMEGEEDGGRRTEGGGERRRRREEGTGRVVLPGCKGQLFSINQSTIFSSSAFMASATAVWPRGQPTDFKYSNFWNCQALLPLPSFLFPPSLLPSFSFPPSLLPSLPPSLHPSLPPSLLPSFLLYLKILFS